MAWRNGSFCPGSCTALRCAPAAALRVQSPCRERDRRGSSLGSSDHKLARGKLYTISTADLITPTPSDFAQVCRRQAAAAAPAAARPPAPAAAAAASLLLLALRVGYYGSHPLELPTSHRPQLHCLVNVRIAFLGDHRRLSGPEYRVVARGQPDQTLRRSLVRREGRRSEMRLILMRHY